LKRSNKALIALFIASSLIAACSGGHGSAVIPQGTTAQSGPTQPMTLGKRIVFYSRTYLKMHPELKWGPNAPMAHFASASNNLVYGGGPVQVNPHIYLVFWGWQSQNDTNADPDGLASYLTNYMKSIGGSPWLNIDTQYYQTLNGVTSYITNPANQVLGVWYDSSVPPQTYADSDVANEAVKAESHFGGYDPNANYIIVTPTGYTQNGFGSQWCGYHNTTTDASGNTIAYTNLPYTPDAGSGCGAGSVNSPGTLDGVSIVGGHEESETATDPGAGNGWLDSSGQEIGDKCAWVSLQNYTFPNGQTFPVQPLWSNAVSGCAMSYGTVATPTPSPTPKPTPTPTPTPKPTPTPTPTPKPTPTPTPTPKPTPVPTPTPTPTPQPCPWWAWWCWWY
jgi:cell division septation protein DedD